MCTLFSVTVNHIVDGTLIVFLEYIGIKNIFTHKFLVGNRSNYIPPVAEEDNDIVKAGTV